MEIQIGLDFEEAFFTTGCHLSGCMKKTESPQAFTFEKSKIANTSYFDIAVKYKNNFCAILIDICRNNESIPSEAFLERKEQLIKICQENDLIPCIFPLNISFGKKNGPYGYGTYFEQGKGTPQEFTPLDKEGWNLIHAVTNKPVNPMEGATEDPMPMSKYEQYYFATDVAKEVIEKKYGPIIMWNDLMPGNEPQLVYHNKARNAEEWCCVRVVDKPTDKLTEEAIEQATKPTHMFNSIFRKNGIYFLLYLCDTNRIAPGHHYNADIKEVYHMPNEIID